LAAVTKREAPAMLFAGVQSSDQAFAATGIATAAFLGWPHAAVVSQLSYSPGAKSAIFRRELEGGLLQEAQIQCPAVLTIQLGINTPRYASLRSIKQAAAKPIETLSLTELDLAAGDVGEAGSASRVRRMYMPDKGRAELISGDVAQQAQRLAEIIREFKGAAS
jgi:electron transfer flavoprotein beta subunit